MKNNCAVQCLSHVNLPNNDCYNDKNNHTSSKPSEECSYKTSVAVFEAGGSIASSCCGVEVGLGCGSGVQEGLHTLTMVGV